jgi:hypothetical protein
MEFFMQDFDLVEALTDSDSKRTKMTVTGDMVVLQKPLPISWRTLRISDCPNLSALPALPEDRLRRLYIYDCPQLSALPALPKGLEELCIGNCPQLSALPALPEGLLDLFIFTCPQLSALPALPKGLIYLQIYDCPQLSALPALPEGVRYLDVEFNNKVITTRKDYQRERVKTFLKEAVLDWWCKPDNMQKLITKYGDPAKAYEVIGLSAY